MRTATVVGVSTSTTRTLPTGHVAHQLDQTGHVEHVPEALAGGLQRDREVGELASHVE